MSVSKIPNKTFIMRLVTSTKGGAGKSQAVLTIDSGEWLSININYYGSIRPFENLDRQRMP